MTKGRIGVAVGFVGFIMVKELVAALVTGTSTGERIITNILALAVAIGVVIAALNTFLKG